MPLPYDPDAAKATLRERGLTAAAADDFLMRSLLTATEAATVLGVKNSRTARDTLRRWSINPVGRGPGRSGENAYPAELIWQAHQNRPGRGWRKGRTDDNLQKENRMPASHVTDDTPWYSDHSTLVRFADILVEAAWLTEPSAVVEFFDRPWKWDPQFQAWTAAGRPQPPDAADRAEAQQLGRGKQRRELERRYDDDYARWGAMLVAFEATEDNPAAGSPSPAVDDLPVAPVVELAGRRRNRNR